MSAIALARLPWSQSPLEVGSQARNAGIPLSACGRLGALARARYWIHDTCMVLDTGIGSMVLDIWYWLQVFGCMGARRQSPMSNSKCRCYCWPGGDPAGKRVPSHRALWSGVVEFVEGKWILALLFSGKERWSEGFERQWRWQQQQQWFVWRQ